VTFDIRGTNALECQMSRVNERRLRDPDPDARVEKLLCNVEQLKHVRRSLARQQRRHEFVGERALLNNRIDLTRVSSSLPGCAVLT